MSHQQEIPVVVAINGQTASKRTRQRVKQGGPDFIQVIPQISKPHRTDEVLLRSTKTGWFGWLPLREILIRRPASSATVE